jgi:hypothetical protein
MNPAENSWLDYLELFNCGADVLAYVIVAFFVFPLWQRTKLVFFAWFGCGALLNLFTSIFYQGILRKLPFDEYQLLWTTHMTLGTISLGFYTIGIVLMARHFEQLPPALSESVEVA